MRKFICRRCGHKWISRKTDGTLPVLCPKCKSPIWWKKRKEGKKMKKDSMPAIGFTIDDRTICPVCYESLIQSEFGSLIAVTTAPSIITQNSSCPKCGLPYNRKAAQKSIKKIISKIKGR